MKTKSNSRKSMSPKPSKKDLSRLLTVQKFPCPLYHRDNKNRVLLDPVQLPAHLQQSNIRCHKKNLQDFLSNSDSNTMPELLLKGSIISWFMDYLNSELQDYIISQLNLNSSFKSCKVGWFCLRGSKWHTVKYLIPENDKMPK